MAYTLEQLQKMGAQPVAPTIAPTPTPSPSAIGAGMTFEQLQKMGAQPVSAPAPTPAIPTPAPQEDGLLKSIIKSPIKELLVKPAIRTGQAIGSLGVQAFGSEEMKRRGEEYLSKDQEVDIPILGKYKIEAVKPGMEGIEQIGGEALKAGSWLTGGKGVATVGKSFLGKRLGTAVAQGVGAGATGGAMYGGGQAMEEGGDIGDIAKGTAAGAAIGGIAGGAVPLVAQGATKLIKGVGGKVAEIPGKVVSKVEAMNQPEHIKKAISTGVDENIVDFVRTAGPKEKSLFSKMVDIAETAGKDLRSRERAIQVPGKEISEGYAGHLIKTKDLGTTQTNRVINSLDNNTPVDVSNVFYTFLNDLKDRGIQVAKTRKGIQLTSKGSIPEGDMSAFKLMYDMLAPDDNGQVLRTYRGLHTARQRIFKELNLAKVRQQPFSDDVGAYADHFRALLADPIDTATKGKYRVAQRTTADAMTALRDFSQLLGYKGDIEKITTKDLKSGETFMRVFGNASDRPLGVLDNVIQTAEKYGYKGKTNVYDLLRMADILENAYGTAQTRSLRGQVGRGALDAVSEATGAATEAAQGNVFGLGARAIKAVLGKSKDDQIRALKELIQKEAGSPTVFGKKVPVEKSVAKVATARYNKPVSKKPAIPKITK